MDLCVHFYVLRNFFRFTYTTNAYLKKHENFLKRIYVYIFTYHVNFYVSRIRQTQVWKLPKFPKMGSDVYIFKYCVNFFVLRIPQTQIWKNTKTPWNGFLCVHFYVTRKFYVSRIRQTQIWKNTKTPWNGFWCVHFLRSA